MRGSGSLVANVEEPVGPGGAALFTGINFETTQNTAQTLVEDVAVNGTAAIEDTWISNDTMRNEYLKRLGSNTMLAANDTNVALCAQYRTEKISNWYTENSSTLYYQIYFTNTANQENINPVIYLNQDSFKNGQQWKTFFIYDNVDGQWYEDQSFHAYQGVPDGGNLMTEYKDYTKEEIHNALLTETGQDGNLKFKPVNGSVTEY